MKKLFVFIGIAGGVTLVAFLIFSIVSGLLVGLVALFGLTLLAVFLGPMRIRRRLDEAETLYENKKYSAALKKIQTLEGWHREDELNILRAKIYFRQNKDELCLETLEKTENERYAVTKLYLTSVLHAFNNRQTESEKAYKQLCALLSDKKAKFDEDPDSVKRMKYRLDLLMKARDPRDGETARRKLLHGSRDKRMIEYLASVAVEATPLYSAQPPQGYPMPQNYPTPQRSQEPIYAPPAPDPTSNPTSELIPKPASASGSDPFVPPDDDS